MEIKDVGRCIGTEETVEFLESLPEMPEEERASSETAEKYERAMNRVRWLAYRVIPAPVRMYNPRGYKTTYECGACAAIVNATNQYCPRCGRALDWKHARLEANRHEKHDHLQRKDSKGKGE